MKQKIKRRVGIKWKLFGFLALFVAVVIALLWVFQTLLLDDFYEAIKRRELIETADAISAQIEQDPDELEMTVASYAVRHSICTIVYRVEKNRARVVANADVISGCLIHHIDSNQRGQYYDAALEAGGSYMEKIVLDALGGDAQGPADHLPPAGEGNAAGTVYIRLAESAAGDEYVIMLNASHAPVSATVMTLQVQLLVLSAVLLVIALLLALVISRHISRPIAEISRKAQQFAGGEYEMTFTGGGFREVDELAATLNYAAAEVAKSDRLQRELLANISHDLRTPLTMIRGYGEVMRDLPGENTPENVQVIIDEAARLSELVGDLLDLSRIRAGTRTLSPECFNLTEAVRGVMGRYGKLTERDGLAITFDAGEDVYVTADRTMLLQVIYNLINNAINYSGSEKRVTVRQTVEGETVRISVTDTGEGIPADQLPLIWDRYYKVDRVHRRAMVGTGLGLSIVKQILDAHRAYYGVDSCVGQGSTFWFALPRSVPGEKREAEL
ncbi:MAG: HAMP domain-containing histidine kinase [Ruminococcaceae bacterium]|nr:HAMP domain-containing histidine kinase [Oscillospiraceae bacterium]